MPDHLHGIDLRKKAADDSITSVEWRWLEPSRCERPLEHIDHSFGEPAWIKEVLIGANQDLSRLYDLKAICNVT